MKQAMFTQPVATSTLFAKSLVQRMKRVATLGAVSLAAVGVLFLSSARVASATTQESITVGTATSPCSSNGLTTGSGTICAGNTTAFSLAALENGTQTLNAVVGSQTAPVYLVVNDTNSTTFTLTLTGAASTGAPLVCKVSGSYSSSECGITGVVGESVTGANYGPPTGAWPNPMVAQFSFTNVPIGNQFDITFSVPSSNDTATFTGPCLGACQVYPACSGSATTTITGTVYVPNGVDPLPNALVYIPSAVPDPLTAGVQCLVAGTEATGSPVAQTHTAVDGTFTLTGVPTGNNIPIVIQSGKWRMQGTIQTVTGCTSNTAPTWATTFPSTHMQGDIPKMALVTGNVDALECVLRTTGLSDSEFNNPGGTGQVDFYHGDGSGGVKINSSTPNESTLVGSPTQLAKYDMVMFPCQGAQYNQSSSYLSNVLNYANSGGRVFATHYSYVWLYDNPTSSTGFGSAATWDINQGSPTPDPGMATVNTNFSGGATLSQWLQNAGSSSTLSQIEISTLRLDQTGVVAPTQSWLTLNTNNTHGEVAHPVMQMTFNTPVGAVASAQCGRVLFNEYHVANASGTNGQTFPSECPSGAMTPQEKLLEYALFDLSTAITPVVAPTVSQSYVNYSPTTTPNTDFTQNDTADTITATVTNTSSTVGLSSSIVFTATLPTGVTATAMTDPTGGWTCTVSTLTCTRTTPLAPSASDSIIITTSVASDAPTGSGGMLTSTISGGGLSSNVNGTDPLTILAGQQPQAITFNPATPVTYGVSPITLSATGGGSGNPVVFSIVSGNGTLSGPNNDILTVTGVGPIVIAANQAGNSSYTAAPQVTGTINVNPAVLTVTAQNATKTYGSANPSFTDVITGFVNGQNASVVSGTASLTTTATTSSPVGSYPITAAQGTLAASNYTFQYVPATLTVTQATGAISWPTPSAITYGTALSATQLDAAYTCGGQTVSGSYSYTPALGAVLGAGNHTLSVTFTPTDTTDCPVTTTTVSLTVNPAVLTVTAQNATKTYGSPNPTFTDTITGYVNGDTSSVVSGTASLTTTANTSSSVGSYPITAAQGTLAASNYTFQYVPATLTVTQPAAAINWPTPTAITYGTPLSSTQLDAAYTCGGQTVAGSYVYTPALGTVLSAGNHTLSVTFTPTDTTDCPVTTSTVSLTVNPAVLTVTAQPGSKTYGSANPALTDVISGYVNGDTSSVVTGTASVTTTAVTGSPVGSYPITAAQGTLAASNYTFNYVPSTLTVNPAVLTVTAQNATRPYNSANPTFTDTIAGFVNGDTASVVSGAASLTTSATLSSSVGSYPIVAAQGSLSAANYTFNYAAGTLQITQLPQVITFTAPSSVPLASGPITLNGTGGGSGNPVTYTVTGPATVLGNVLTFTGVGTVTVTANQAGNTNYTAAAPVVQTINMVQPPVDSQVKLSFSNTVPANSTTWTYPGEANADMCVTTTTGKFATGQIELLDGATVLTTQTLQPGGCADWYITPGLNVGTHYFTAYYLGDGTNPAGYSNLIVITVPLYPSQLEVDCWSPTFAYGADYQCDANPDDPAILPGGIVYSVNGGTGVTVPFNNVGHSLWSLSKPAVGSYTMTINYPQTTNYAAFALPTQHFTVTPADVELSFLPDNWSPNAGQHVTLQASVASASAGAPNGIGSVAFSEGSHLFATVAVDANGNANYTTTFTSGMHHLTATYTGANYSTTTTSIDLGVQ